MLIALEVERIGNMIQISLRSTFQPGPGSGAKINAIQFTIKLKVTGSP